MRINKYISWVVDRNHDRSIGLGLDIYTHKHMEGCRNHFHILITFLLWFWELQIGDDTLKEK